MSINEKDPVNQKEEKKEVKPTPINKYSIHEMKSAIDTKIVEFLEESKFTENHFLSNIKIAVGLFCLSFTALAFFYPKPFPENYNVVLLSVIMYTIGSIIYYYVDKYLLKQIFYSGFNENYIKKIRQGKKEKLNNIKISSEIKDYSKNYEVWFDFVTDSGHKIQSERKSIDCTQVCDARGYVLNNLVHEKFMALLNEDLAKLN